MNSAPLRMAVLISGTGSNLKTLIDANESGAVNLDIRLVISSNKDAKGLEHACRAGIPIKVIAESNSSDQDKQVTASLVNCDPELIVLAGYMRILGAEPLDAFPGRLINLHPSLLPLYPGLDTYQRALDAGDKFHGASIHFVTPELDGGPVISQVQIKVLEIDSAPALAARLGPREHSLLRSTVELFCHRRVEMKHDHVYVDGRKQTEPLLLNENDQLE